VCPEPVDHGTVLRFLATLRFPLWVLLVGVLAVRRLGAEGLSSIPHRSIHALLDAQLAVASSTWLLVMVPVGLPLLYFSTGILAHIGIGLTGGAQRSLGATMRAVGYALGPSLFAVAVLDWPIYFGALPGAIYFPLLGVVALVFWTLAAVALAQTHRISWMRAVLVVFVPVCVFAFAHAGRAMLDLASIPGVEPPQSPYYVP